MGKRSHRKRSKRGRRGLGKQIEFLTRGMAGANPLAIARRLGLGKDDAAIRRALRKSKN